MTNTPAGLRIVFAGTPDFAAAHLQALLHSAHHVVACYTQPDRPAGRGKKLQASPVKQMALAHGIRVEQPPSLKDSDAQQQLASYAADVMVVVAYGLLLPSAILNTPTLGCINVHASLLPRWRGAAPIQRAIAAGDSETGVTIMQMDEGLDTGAMLVRHACPIRPTDTGAQLHDRLLGIGAPALLEALQQLMLGTANPTAQDHSQSNYAPKISKAEAAIDWRQSAAFIDRTVRAFNPFPIAHTARANNPTERIRLWRASPGDSVASEPGCIHAVTTEALVIACGEGSLHIHTLQLPGKRTMSIAELLRGKPDLFQVGEQLELPL
ncbi:MAG TPA: methionyl-tRNA formyltransferase [Marinobacter sp.]|nr:methionyl-tRNA formyltransferase [Marinobacter sp.]